MRTSGWRLSVASSAPPQVHAHQREGGSASGHTRRKLERCLLAEERQALARRSTEQLSTYGPQAASWQRRHSMPKFLCRHVQASLHGMPRLRLPMEAVLSTPLFDSNEEARLRLEAVYCKPRQIEHLFLIFRLLGTPGRVPRCRTSVSQPACGFMHIHLRPGHWPEALRCRNFSPRRFGFGKTSSWRCLWRLGRFPVYKPVDLGAVTRATARAAVGDCSEA